MNKNKIVIDLDVNLNHVKNITLKQYNQYSQWIVIRITENGKPFFIDDKDVCIFKMLTPDKREIYNDCVFVDNCIVVEITKNCCINSGMGIAELNILDQDKESQIASFNFNIVIEKSAYDNENIEGSNEYKSLADRVIAADKAIENAEIATDNANTAAENADAATKDLQDKLDSHHFVLTEDKDIANGVPSLDENIKVPIIELYEATTSQKGITQLADSITSTSITTAATPNSVKMVNDSIIAEHERATNIEGNLESKKANISSPTFTGIPKAPTASVGTNTTQIATTEFVQTSVSNGIAASDAMIIKGTIGSDTVTGIQGTISILPTTYKTGWTYRVVANGTYAGQVCEIGDLIIALVDRNGTNNADSDWCIAQTNINGAITGIKSGDAYIECSQSGSVITIKHKDVHKTNTTSTAAPSNGGSFTAIKSITSDTKGHITGVNTETVTLPPGTLTEFLTQEAYDALPQSVQENGTIYFVPDSNTEINPGENEYSIPVASSSVRGGVKIGYTQNGRNFPVQLSNERAYVNVPENETLGADVALLKSYFPLHFSTASVSDDTFIFTVVQGGFNVKLSSKAYRKFYKLGAKYEINLPSSTNYSKCVPKISTGGSASFLALLSNSAAVSTATGKLTGELNFFIYSNATEPYFSVIFEEVSTGNRINIDVATSMCRLGTTFEILIEKSN